MKNLLIALMIACPSSTSVIASVGHSFTPVEFLSIKGHVSSLVKMDQKKLNSIAWSIYKASKQYEVSHEIMTSIIMVESSFNHNAVSSTGDISIVQINYKIWEKESKRLGWEISRERLKKDSDYAIHCMGRILNHLQNRYSKLDSKWFARYHSKTPDLKIAYAGRIAKNMNKSLTLASNFE